MDTLNFYGLLAVIFFLTYPFQNILICFLQIFIPESPLPNIVRLTCRGAVILITMLFAGWSIPLPFYYLSLFGIFYIVFLRSFEERTYCIFVINQTMILYTALHMLVLGSFAVYLHTGIHTVLQRNDTRLLSLAITLCLFYFLTFFLSTEDRREKIRIVPQCMTEFTLYIKYSKFALAYILFDSFSAFLELPGYLMILFLLGSTFLILLQTYVCFTRVEKIAQNAYLEDEYLNFITERKIQAEREEILRREMHIDALTGAYSRRYIEDNIQALIEKHRPFTLVYIDLDGLKKINDTLGHAAGDEHLKEFSRLLRKYLHKNDILARVGGDEFYVVLPDCSIDAAYERMTFIQTRLTEEANAHSEYPLDFSFGLSVPQPGRDMDALIQTADRCMYTNKSRRRHP